MIEVPLTQGKVALVDEQDSWVLRFKWQYDRGYAVRTEGRAPTKKYYMHREILPGVGQVDHANGNKTDNRRANLRSASRTENGRNRPRTQANSSGFKGVHFHRQSGKWRARIVVDKKPVSLGLHATPEAASAAYESAALQLFGEFAWNGEKELTGSSRTG